MAGPKSGQKENIAYTITSGFYPELASRIKWGGMLKGSKGAVGAKYAERRGFADSSLRRIKSEAKNAGQKGFSDDGIPLAFKRKAFGKTLEGAPSGTAYIKRETATPNMGSFFSPGQQISKILGTGTAFNEDSALVKEATEAGEHLEKISYTKWMGGSELYRLYGTKVWYMEGNRNKGSLQNTLDMWSKAVAEGDSGALPENYLNNIYSRSEPELIKLATQMANEIFDNALNESKLQENLDSIGRGEADVPEEDVAEARKAMKTGMKDYARSSDIKIDNRSYAQKIDVLTRNADNTADIYIDSTEVALTEDKGHGIVTAGAEIKRAVENLKDGGETETLRQAVVKMFIKNITGHYNPIITKLKDFMKKNEDKNNKNEKASFKKLLDSVEKERKKSSNDWKKTAKMGQAPDKISVSNIATAAGVRMGKMTTVQRGGEVVNTSAMKYVVHMLASLGDNQSRLFRQGHRIATWPDGSKTYASVPMGISPSTMLFYKSGKERSPHGTTILRGSSHLLALATANGALAEGRQAEVNQRQTQAHARSRIHGSSESTRSRAQLGANQDARRKCHNTTRVSFSPKALSEKFEEVMGMMYADGKWRGKNVEKEALPNIKENLSKYTHSWPTKNVSALRKKGSISGAQSLTRTGLINANRFWALPYIGINDNIYRGKGAVQK